MMKKKVLISWVAFNNDFINGQVNVENSPNYIFHREFWDGYEKHLILSAAKSDNLRLNLLLNCLHTDFKDHTTEGVYMSVDDVIDFHEIKPKVENLLLEYSDYDIDIFISPGTSIMQMSWYACHTSLNLKTRLVQTRPASKSKTKEPELLEIKVEKSSTPITAIIREKNLSNKMNKYAGLENYEITKSLKPVYEKAFKIAQTDRVTTLILGESGTGKEHLAQFVHLNSTRRKDPYLAINCSAFNDELLESRLFGYKKGSFTGAAKDSPGLFKEAHQGTVFLDEIGDISPYMQQSLLRVLQQKEICPLGGKPEIIDVRVVAATNKNLVEQCTQGKFRWDLYYRLAVAELELPSLDERGPKDVGQLIDFFVGTKQIELQKASPLSFDKAAHDFLLDYPYPGNVRELENLIETLYIYCDDKVTINDIPKRFKIVAANRFNQVSQRGKRIAS